MASELEVGKITSAETIEIGNGYAVQFGGTNYRLRGSNSGGFIALDSAAGESLKIDSSGAVSLGPGTAAVTTLKPSLLVTDTSVGGSVTVRGKSPILAFDRTDSGTGTILTDGGGLKVKTGTLDHHGSDMLWLKSTGEGVFSGGINLGHETITKYDEGTFTPSLQFGGATTGITYGSIRGGVYTRIGRLVYVQIAFALTSKGTATGAATIAGMPFTAGDLIASTSLENALSFSHFSGLSDAVAFINGTSVTLRNLAGTNLTNGAFTDSSSIRIAGCYTLASS